MQLIDVMSLPKRGLTFSPIRYTYTIITSLRQKIKMKILQSQTKQKTYQIASIQHRIKLELKSGYLTHKNHL